MKDQKKIVIPGELLSQNPSLSGPGTYISGGNVYASVCGILAEKGKISVHPLSGPYIPKKNDIVIGYATVITSSNWIFDIGCPYEGLLHVTEYPQRVPSEEMRQHFDVGDTVLLKVTDVNSEMKVELTYKDPVCRKLTRGRLFEVPASKVSRIIGRSGAMISMLKAKTGCEIFVGGNGRIWMNGNSADLDILMRALSKIEADARLPGLTDLTAEFIDNQYAAIGRTAANAEAFSENAPKIVEAPETKKDTDADINTSAETNANSNKNTNVATDSKSRSGFKARTVPRRKKEEVLPQSEEKNECACHTPTESESEKCSGSKNLHAMRSSAFKGRKSNR